METIFEKSHQGRSAHAQTPNCEFDIADIPEKFLRLDEPILPECSELEVLRHYINLSQKNFCIDTNFYPLGSCTMKYNPRGVHHLASEAAWNERHPLIPNVDNQGLLRALFDLQSYIATITGMHSVSLSPMAGSQGEFAGVAMIKAYHTSRGDFDRTEMLVPDAAHGTNPASAAMCGYKVREIPTGSDGNIDINALKEVVGPQTAGVMLTNPSTLGVFGRHIMDVQQIIHDAGGLLYYDGANLNAILGKVAPGDMGFDVMHLNLHKTFATPHGGGGPGSGPIAASKRLSPYLPIPRVYKNGDKFDWLTTKDCPDTIGRLSTFSGNTGILLRAYIYTRMLGREGLTRVAEFATLNANYIQACLSEAGFELAYPDRRASHEFIITLKDAKQNHDISATDVAKRLLDFGIHAPTTYFPLLIPECFLIEPTETESKQTLDTFVDAMVQIKHEITDAPDMVRNAPHTCPVRRLDEVKAARDLDLIWDTDRVVVHMGQV